MQRQAKPVWIYLYWAWPTSAARANTWLHPCVRLRGWGGGLCIRQGGQRVREMLRMWRQGYMTVCLARSHRNITSLPRRNPGWDKSVQSVGLWVLFISVTAVKEASYKCIHICTYPQRYPPKPTSHPNHQIRAKFHCATPKSRGTQEHCSVLLDTQSPPLGAGDCWSDLPDKHTPPKQTQHELCLTLLPSFKHPCVCGGTAFGISLEGKRLSALVSYPLNSPHWCEWCLA